MLSATSDASLVVAKKFSGKKLVLQNYQSPGDIVMLLHTLVSLHATYPRQFITDVRCSVPDIFKYNPLVTKIALDDEEAQVIDMHYPQIHQSNNKPIRFITAFTAYLSDKLGLPIQPTNFSSFLYISEQEKAWYSAVHEKLGRDVPYWIINAGHKQDYTAKAWSFQKYQELVARFPDVWFVQVGATEHKHPELTGDNVINMVGKTNIRQMIRLVYNSFGVISGVSFPMHLSYAVPPHPRFGRKCRANITIAGGREPPHWEEGPNHHYLHTCGMLSCCDNGGCWKSRIVPLNDGAKERDESLCVAPVELPNGQWVGKCMEMITVDDVARVVQKYVDNLEYEPKK
jgi:hypothetical protein